MLVVCSPFLHPAEAEAVGMAACRCLHGDPPVTMEQLVRAEALLLADLGEQSTKADILERWRRPAFQELPC